MSGGFFPPPPPPPGQSGWSGHGAARGSQDRGGRGRGGGRGGSNDRRPDRGRGRSGNRGRYPTGGQSAGQHQDRSLGHPNTYRQQQQYGVAPQGTIPAGAYVNPNFRPPPSANGFSANPATARLSPPRPPSASSPQRTYAGHKRKLDALRPPQEERKNPGPQTAPSVPSFGAPLLAQQSIHALPRKPQSKPASASNALGLTPGDAEPQYSSSEDEADDKDVDEEALHAELGAKLTFEHNGLVLSLNSEADLAAWRNERRAKWPTRARMAERDAEKWRIGQERKRLLASAALLADAATTTESRTRRLGGQDNRRETLNQQSETSQEPKAEDEVAKARRELSYQTTVLDRLRKNLTAGEACLAKLRAHHETDNLISTDEAMTKYGAAAMLDDSLVSEAHDDVSDTSSEVLSESSVLSPTSSGDSESDNDGPPEEATTKASIPQMGRFEAPLCRYFAASGYCRDGDACRFQHKLAPGVKPAAHTSTPQRRDPSAPKLDYSATAERKSIHQRLLDQQQEEEDRLALRVIKYLGTAGFFSSEGVMEGGT